MRTALTLFLFLAASTHAADLPKFWTVHVDVARDRAAFERADRADVETRAAFYTAHRIPEPAAWRIAGADGIYFTLRPRGASLADLAKPSTLTPEQSKELNSRVAPLSDAAHQTLRDHHNEIWQLDPDFTTIASVPDRRYALLRTDTVFPSKVREYNEAITTIVKELGEDGVEVISFYSAYGDGTARYVFLSDRPLRVKSVGKLARTKDVEIRSSWRGNVE